MIWTNFGTCESLSIRTARSGGSFFRSVGGCGVLAACWASMRFVISARLRAGIDAVLLLPRFILIVR